ncbi:type II toxin-antitoxin system HigA family antitoxin [Promineifilum sp.]|uniref:helix-turn-helix domain-containing protein n=1 Tax=Promineifilum sp. TaxID=2664178 RepID=UPI0035AEF8B6
MEVRPIRNEADYQYALQEIDRLLHASSGTADEDRLEVLITLVDAYEEATEPIGPPDPIEAILFYLENQQLPPEALEPYLGRDQVTVVLERRVPLSLEMIRNLREGLGIPADILIQRYELEAA